MSELKSKKIFVSNFTWKIASFFHENRFIPKAGEYIIPKNSSIFEIQRTFQNGKTLTRNFTLIEGTTAVELEKKLITNPYLTEIKICRDLQT